MVQIFALFVPVLILRPCEGVFYIRGRGFVFQIIEPVTFAHCTFIFVLWNIDIIYGFTYAIKN